MSDHRPAPPSLSRKIAYAAIATLLGVVVIAGATELSLRWAGYGYSPHFARRQKLATGETVWRDNRWCTAPFFTPALVRRPQPFRLEDHKPAGTYRIFVLGSSAAMGDPDASFSLSRMLEGLLTAAYPGTRFEVVNAGITAINTHLVRGIAADCAQLEPDLFIVYEGNNEVIGPFGPSAVFAPFLRSSTLIRMAAWAQGTRTGQALGAFARGISRHGDPAKDWGGMQMFLGQQITIDDPRLDSVCAHFAENLQAISASAQRAGAHTLLCTVVTNQRDFAPFSSQHRAGLPDAERRQWDADFAAALAAERTHDPAQAEARFGRALAIDDRYAELPFRLGRLQLQLGKNAEGAASLQRALDLDALRFRTDSRLNATIRDVAAHAPGTTLVDLATELAARSAHGSPGDDLLYEHVHLTFRGTYDAAVQLMPQIGADLLRRHLASGPPAKILTIDEMRQRLAFTIYEQATIALELLNRFRAAPFTGQIDDGLRVRTWQRRFDAANAMLSRPEATDYLASTYAAARRLAPNDWVLERNAGEMLVARHRPADAVPLLQAAAAIIPDDADTIVALGLAQQALGHTAEAKTAFDTVRRIEPGHPLLPH